jgi:hypothetical protein
MIEVLKQMVEALEWCHGGEPIGTAEAIQAGKQLIAELESQELKQVTVKDFIHMVEGKEDLIGRPIYFAQWPNGNAQPPQRTWVGLMRGVRVEGDTVVISVHYGNDAARQVCGALIEEMNT